MDKALNTDIKMCAAITVIYASFHAVYDFQGRTQNGVTRASSIIRFTMMHNVVITGAFFQHLVY